MFCLKVQPFSPTLSVVFNPPPNKQFKGVHNVNKNIHFVIILFSVTFKYRFVNI